MALFSLLDENLNGAVMFSKQRVEKSNTLLSFIENRASIT